MNAGQSGYRVAELAARLGGEVQSGDGEVMICGINSLTDAQRHDITFVIDAKYARQWRASPAGAVVVSRHAIKDLPADERPVIVVDDADVATIALLQLFAPLDDVPDVGVHPAAVVHPTAKLSRNVRIGPHVSVGRNCIIGNDVVLHAGARINSGATIGAGTIIHSNTVVRERCVVGRSVLLHQNVSIGADGFGYRPDPGKPETWSKVPQIGNVVIGDRVEIGSGTCIDRAKFGSTVIGDGTKIDNLVHIAHNCRIGRNCLIMALVGLAGSIEVGDEVIIAGQVAIADHLKIGRKARIGPKSGVMHDIPDGETWLGVPAGPDRETLRQWAAIRKLPALIRGRSGHDSVRGRQSGTGHHEPGH